MYPSFISTDLATNLFNSFRDSVTWHREVSNSEGKKVHLSRGMAYLHEPPVDYLYAGLTLPGASLNDDIHGLIVLFKEKLTLDFNSVLLNYYQDGKDKINWHSDKEDQLGINPIIGSLNLGATRKFHFLRKSTGEKLSVDLSHGDFFVMESGCQENFLHAILPEKHVKDPRISLTFRRVVC